MSFYKKFIKKPLKHIGQSAPVMWLISAFIYAYAKFVGLTTKWTLDGVDRFYELTSQNDGVILLIWHGRALMLPYFWNPRSGSLYALVSLHRDGRMIAGLLERFGIRTIGGSSNENAVGGAVGLMHAVKKNASICIIPDGPRGPRMHMRHSPLYYAQKTGKPIVCASYSIKKSCIISKAWDQMMIPLPFSEGICRLSAPIYVPADADKEKLEEYRLLVEKTLNEVSISCDKQLGLTPVLPDDGSGKTKKHRQ
ncbi:MAG: lysophospholipid acyltransferase family protein [Alphaproteobacteria bacterium]|nr:lysophospholipid acyltransferase family protein [Alphaproteobacteria bacterium]